MATHYIFDIQIDNNRYVSYPVWLDQNKYLNYKYTKAAVIDPDLEGNNSEEELLSNVVKLKMFNIVIEFEKKNSILIANPKNLSTIYKVLESFSQFA